MPEGAVSLARWIEDEESYVSEVWLLCGDRAPGGAHGLDAQPSRAPGTSSYGDAGTGSGGGTAPSAGGRGD